MLVKIPIKNENEKCLVLKRTPSPHNAIICRKKKEPIKFSCYLLLPSTVSTTPSLTITLSLALEFSDRPTLTELDRLRLCRISAGSCGFSPVARANKFKISVKLTTPDNRPLRFAPGLADAEMVALVAGVLGVYGGPGAAPGVGEPEW